MAAQLDPAAVAGSGDPWIEIAAICNPATHPSLREWTRASSGSSSRTPNPASKVLVSSMEKARSAYRAQPRRWPLGAGGQPIGQEHCLARARRTHHQGEANLHSPVQLVEQP